MSYNPRMMSLIVKGNPIYIPTRSMVIKNKIRRRQAEDMRRK